MSKCYTCREPAGNAYAGSYSAYCGDCQPKDTRPDPKGSQCRCSPCGRTLATVTDFEAHQETYPKGHRLEGVFTGRCFDPESIGLELRSGVWGTPEGNANRNRKSARLKALGRKLAA